MSGSLPRGPGEVVKPSRRVGSPYRRAGRGLESLTEGWEGSGGPLRGPGGVGSPSRRTGRGRKAIPEDREGSKSHPGGLVVPPGGLGKV